MKAEIWKQVVIESGPTPYEVSNMGKVRRYHPEKNAYHLKNILVLSG